MSDLITMPRAVAEQALEALVWEAGSEHALYSAQTFSAITALRAKLAQQAEPMREWQGLTEEQLRKMHHEDQFGLFCDYDEFEQIARAVEQALKEKNHG